MPNFLVGFFGSNFYWMFKSGLRWACLVLALLLVYSHFAKENYRGVDYIRAESLQNPAQFPVTDKGKISFTGRGYAYEMEPLYEYQLTGLIVSKISYGFSPEKLDQTFPLDLCMIWGDNLSPQVYRNPDLAFKQDMRFCFYNYSDTSIKINAKQLANNHLLSPNKAVLQKMKAASVGDQVVIYGKLVNLTAKKTDANTDIFNPDQMVWKSSTNRDDNGAGACEVIYVDEFKILEHGHPMLKAVHYHSSRALIGIGMLFVGIFILRTLIGA